MGCSDDWRAEATCWAQRELRRSSSAPCLSSDSARSAADEAAVFGDADAHRQLSSDYAAWFHSQRPRDPRLPVPLCTDETALSIRCAARAGILDVVAGPDASSELAGSPDRAEVRVSDAATAPVASGRQGGGRRRSGGVATPVPSDAPERHSTEGLSYEGLSASAGSTRLHADDRESCCSSRDGRDGRDGSGRETEPKLPADTDCPPPRPHKPLNSNAAPFIPASLAAPQPAPAVVQPLLPACPEPVRCPPPSPTVVQITAGPDGPQVAYVAQAPRPLTCCQVTACASPSCQPGPPGCPPGGCQPVGCPPAPPGCQPAGCPPGCQPGPGSPSFPPVSPLCSATSPSCQDAAGRSVEPLRERMMPETLDTAAKAPSAYGRRRTSGRADEWRRDKQRDVPLPAGNWKLSDIQGRVVEHMADQDASRLLQKKLESSTPQECDAVCQEILPAAVDLMKNVFGNYVLQRLLEHCSVTMRKALAGCIKGHVIELSMHTYGCRIVQKCIEIMDPAARDAIFQELDGHVAMCVRDQNGNHVIQKCVERMPQHVRFIVQTFVGRVCEFATHTYGCRCLQRILENCHGHEEIVPILEEVLEHVHSLVTDQYGNYVVQHVLINGNPQYQYTVTHKLRGYYTVLSTHKFASNVVEKMFEYATPQLRVSMLEEMMSCRLENGQSGLVNAVTDQYGNYVIQKIFDLCDDTLRRLVAEHLQPHVQRLRRAPYAKHFISRLEKAEAFRGGRPDKADAFRAQQPAPNTSAVRTQVVHRRLYAAVPQAAARRVLQQTAAKPAVLELRRCDQWHGGQPTVVYMPS
eukprot:TRINITY_DN2235_c1_g1_i6.p1 TRINITY_DN2235_c1_g1~~TRINITY_DN2235_c1_g1_i6.p1  ORF type:complete len:806 (+),score=222.08 TRINITY_DN2235_c1_g1_i6:167-2584(+)